MWGKKFELIKGINYWKRGRRHHAKQILMTLLKLERDREKKNCAKIQFAFFCNLSFLPGHRKRIRWKLNGRVNKCLCVWVWVWETLYLVHVLHKYCITWRKHTAFWILNSMPDTPEEDKKKGQPRIGFFSSFLSINSKCLPIKDY